MARSFRNSSSLSYRMLTYFSRRETFRVRGFLGSVSVHRTWDDSLWFGLSLCWGKLTPEKTPLQEPYPSCVPLWGVGVDRTKDCWKYHSCQVPKDFDQQAQHCHKFLDMWFSFRSFLNVFNLQDLIPFHQSWSFCLSFLHPMLLNPITRGQLHNTTAWSRDRCDEEIDRAILVKGNP